ncbi:DUF6883 domain-containing protein [Nodosilinea sp. PGN35]|uniref:DUF6883 domain-containing protein n=1 Tax=Nodosilinea sp. PGN35 TaxID=3020489 RepID=UPI0023B2BA0E|nr:DUF6883 domain-containing protein [Nodosilinea sp. TSF1-S3]MDF0365688.1 hypothetical protein [Nodosilinea sp. TSF1-S3]
MKLPNPDQTVISADKLEGYSLNPNHSEGRHKAVVFQSALGLNLENVRELRAALIQAIKTQEAISTKRNAYGQKYQIEFEMTRNGKTALVRSIWIVRHDENFPRLVTCYIP